MTDSTVEAINGERELRVLPKGWRWVRLGEVSEIVAGQSPPGETYRKSPEGLPFFQGKADFGIRHPVPRVWCVAPSKIALPGDILVSVRAPVGPTNVADTECCIGRGLATVRCGKETDRDFLLAALRFYEGHLSRLGSGSTFSAINRNDLESLVIPLPMLSEQRRVAAILNEQMAAVEWARAGAEAQLEAAKALPAAYLRAVFNSPEPPHWAKARLGDLLIAPLKTGISKPTVLNAQKRCLILSAVRNGTLDLTASKPVDVSDAESEDNWVKSGAFYVVRGNGNLSLVGRGALAPMTGACRVLYPDLLIEINIDMDRVEGSYLQLVWNSDEIRRDIETRARTSAGIYKINQANLVEVKIPLLSISEQQRIVAALSKQMADADRLRKGLEEQLAAIDALPASLLRRAFRGEL